MVRLEGKPLKSLRGLSPLSLLLIFTSTHRGSRNGGQYRATMRSRDDEELALSTRGRSVPQCHDLHLSAAATSRLTRCFYFTEREE
ncbi:hypothetical protein RRG08_038060 [Elysia crispata]|uniref:Uncharacterized protein n=1 Tax=Elysia crispata TaxID=231223 RepID=A0AAE1DP04_9GAST|nr:hypothetical protein RRG08_038060 [Elysia crispata]